MSEFPTRTPAREVDNRGVNIVGSKVAELGWAYRNRPQQHDYGIDGDVDIFEDNNATGKTFAVQIKTGNLLGYKTYVSDPSKIAFDEKLGNLATIKEVPQLLRNASEIKRVDAIWYKSQPPFFLFEVEDGGTMREALHRLYNAMAFDARFIVVCPPENRKKFEKWVSTQPFLEFRDRYQYRTYSELFEFYKTIRSFIAMRQRFLNVPKHI